MIALAKGCSMNPLPCSEASHYKVYKIHFVLQTKLNVEIDWYCSRLYWGLTPLSQLRSLSWLPVTHMCFLAFSH